MANGRVDIRTNEKTGKARLRFYNAFPDQLGIILPALAHARSQLGTQHDTVALEAICMDYLNSASVSKAVKSSFGTSEIATDCTKKSEEK